MSEFVEDGKSGLLVEPGKPESLAAAMHGAFRHPEKMKEFGFAARQVFEANYSTEANYQRLMEIYQRTF
jgi:glycosyltransferase involved in cell wall biosynthesis